MGGLASNSLALLNLLYCNFSSLQLDDTSAPVAVVDKNANKKGTQEVATAFVKYLFTPESQEEFAKVGFRPVNGAVASKYASKFPKVPKLYTVSAFGGWGVVQDKFFKDGGVFDQVFQAK